MTRPSFDSVLHFTADKTKHIDSRTGLPLHSKLFRQTLDMIRTDIQREESLPAHLHKIKLKSDAKLHPTACIVLDAIESLQSVQCLFHTQQQLVLTFDSPLNAVFVYKKWIISGAQFVSGGQEWGCRNVTTHQPMLIIQRLASIQLNNKQIVIDTSKNISISPIVCFTNMTLSLTVEQGVSTRVASLWKKSTIVTEPESKYFSDSWNFTPLEPHGGETCSPAETIVVRWSYSGIDGTNNLKIALNRKRLGWDAEVHQLNTKINTQHVNFTIPASLHTSSQDQYYFEFYFRYKFVSHKKTSAIFHITTHPSIMPGTSPREKDVYYPGDSVLISWRSVNFNATSLITIQFRRARTSITQDATLDTFTVMVVSNAYMYNISSSLYRSDNDQHYYFEFDYCTSWLSSNCKQTTKHFFIPTRPYLHVTFPTVGDWFLPSQPLRLTWTSANFVNDNDLLTIKLWHNNYLLPDSNIGTFACTVNSSGLCSYTLPAVGASPSGYYFEFSWCEHWYSVQCTVRSNQFAIPIHAAESWNYDTQRGHARKPTKLYSSTCIDTCPTRDSKLDYLCRMCTDDRSMVVQLACANCWAVYDYSLVQIDLVRKENSHTLDHLAVRVHSSIFVNIDLAISANYAHMFHGTLPLPPIPIIRSFPFSIGNIPFDLGMSLVSAIPWYIDVNTVENFTIGVDYQLQTNLTLTASANNITRDFKQTLTHHIHPMEGQFQGSVKIDLAFRPILQLSAGIFVLELGTEGYFIFENSWHYPPFAALSTSNFDWNKQHIAAFHISIPSDACTLPHFIRYHTTFGIRNTKISLAINIVDALVNYLTNMTLSYSTSSLLDLGPYELTSGCIYSAGRYTDIRETIYLVFNRRFNPLKDTNDEYLSRSVVFDLAYALNVSRTRLYYKNAYSVQDGQMTGVMIALLPSLLVYTTDPTVSQLLQMLEIEQMNVHSSLHSGSITSSLNLQQTRIANTRKPSLADDII